MKKQIIILFSIFLSLGIFAQEFKTSRSILKADASKDIYRHTYFLNSFTNIGENEIADAYAKAQKNIQIVPKPELSWLRQPFYYMVDNEADAQMTINGTYKYTTSTTTETEIHKAVLPYFMTFTQHNANAEVIYTYTYKDGTPTKMDTMNIDYASKDIPGKDFDPIDTLEKRICHRITTIMDKPQKPLKYKNDYIEFPKVKIKDKTLKEEYSNVEDLCKAGKYAEAGAICKKVYDAENTPENSAALGLCYELMGNFPKANKYIKPYKDFHTKSRIRKDIAILKFAQSVGFEPEFPEL